MALRPLLSRAAPRLLPARLRSTVSAAPRVQEDAGAAGVPSGCPQALGPRLEHQQEGSPRGACPSASLRFEDPQEAFRSKNSWELLRSLLVFKLCSYDVLVEKNQELTVAEGGAALRMESDSGYGTINMNSKRGQEETKGAEADPPMDTVETDGEATAGRGFNINIFCVCSKEMESPANLKNRLCKQCIATMDEDGAKCTIYLQCTVCHLFKAL